MIGDKEYECCNYSSVKDKKVVCCRLFQQAILFGKKL